MRGSVMGGGGTTRDGTRTRRGGGGRTGHDLTDTFRYQTQNCQNILHILPSTLPSLFPVSVSVTELYTVSAPMEPVAIESHLTAWVGGGCSREENRQVNAGCLGQSDLQCRDPGLTWTQSPVLRT